MSQRANSPYEDVVDEDGRGMWYEGHDEPRSQIVPIPKLVDQQLFLASGRPNENGKFWNAALRHKKGVDDPEMVLAFDKIKKGLWTFAGVFRLTDAREQHDGTRRTYQFRLDLDEAASVDGVSPEPWSVDPAPDRVIPTDVKIEVWNRDGGRCTKCKATDDLHFDHVLPYAKGGSSRVADNIQLLCARHNLEKSDRLDM